MNKYLIAILSFLFGLIACLAVSCSKDERDVVDPSRLSFSKWVVVSTSDNIFLYPSPGWGKDEKLFAVDDTVSFGIKSHKGRLLNGLFISRPNESRFLPFNGDDYTYYWRSLDYDIIEDNKAICLSGWHYHYFDVIKYNKKQLILRYDQTGAKVTMKKL